MTEGVTPSSGPGSKEPLQIPDVCDLDVHVDYVEGKGN